MSPPLQSDDVKLRTILTGKLNKLNRQLSTLVNLGNSTEEYTEITREISKTEGEIDLLDRYRNGNR